MIMSKNKKEESQTSVKNLVTTLIYTTEAMINILEKKDVLNRAEIIAEIKAMRKSAEAARKQDDN